MDLDVLVLCALSLLAALLSWAGVRLIRNYEIGRQGLGTTPATPRGGGLAILVVVLLIFMPAALYFDEPAQVVRFALSGAFFGIIGFVDDFRTLPRPIRLGLQALAALIFVPAAPIQQIALPRLIIEFSLPVAYLISTLWIVVMSNAYNYMDGIDGLAGGQA